MDDPILLSDMDDRGVLRLTMNRPEVRNAFNTDLISLITTSVTSASTDPAVRIIVLSGTGTAFSAGADLHMMQAVAKFSEHENITDANRLADMLMTIHRSPKPVVARVNGPALGGGVGLLAACDWAIGVDTAFFALSEARLGLIPAAISPFVIHAIGARQASRYFLSGERISAAHAVHMGLLHSAVPPDQLEAALDDAIGHLLACGPNAKSEAKQLIQHVTGQLIDGKLMQDVAKRIARVRASQEGQEGIAAFLEKRQPGWKS